MHERVNILGVEISAVNMSQTLECFEEWIGQREPNYVCVTPAHGVMDCLEDGDLREIFNHSGLTTPDGMAIVWLLRWRGARHVERIYGPDLMLKVCERGLKSGWRHYFYGGKPGVPEALEKHLKERYPELQVAGHHSPPFHPLSPEEDGVMVEGIQATRPDIVWVGISTPKQERWMSEHVGRLGVPALVGVGAAFDFLSGEKRQAPRWIQRSGLEWLFRLINEPRRLWRRYIRYPKFAVLAIFQFMGLKKYETE